MTSIETLLEKLDVIGVPVFAFVQRRKKEHIEDGREKMERKEEREWKFDRRRSDGSTSRRVELLSRNTSWRTNARSRRRMARG